MKLFLSLKIEHTARKVHRSRSGAGTGTGADVFDYIERINNPGRRHSKLG